MKQYLRILITNLFLTLSISVAANHIVVDKWEYIPEVKVDITKDTHRGWNLRVDTTNFVFDPNSAGASHEVGHGHGHLYINDKKMTRIYSEWTYIPSEWLNKGHNKVEVTLNANTHEELWYKDSTISDSEIIFHTQLPVVDHHGH